jgi:DNA modification methylase
MSSRVVRCNVIHTGDALHILPTLPENSVDAIVCDPPAGISFMGKAFDSNRGGRSQWIAWLAEIMAEARRVLKPGGHALVWALPRTSHWTACALEDAGFEIRDKLYHLFASGFPKSLDVSKAIDKHLGAEREWIPQGPDFPVTAPATPEAHQWAGYGTALKPAVEEWILCRKPLTEPSVARNVLMHGTGGINIDGCRIGAEPITTHKTAFYTYNGQNSRPWHENHHSSDSIHQGRWPSHLLISHAKDCQPGVCVPGCPALELDEQGGFSKSHGEKKRPKAPSTKNTYGKYKKHSLVGHTDQGGVSRYFTQFYYAPKASTTERNRGCEGLPEQRVARMGHDNDEPDERTQSFQPQANTHPTVKNQQLMRWLCRLITPPGGIVLDCFAGSGSTGVAAITEGFQFIGIEIDPEYAQIARARLEYAMAEAEKEAQREKQSPLFDHEQPHSIRKTNGSPGLQTAFTLWESQENEVRV